MNNFDVIFMALKNLAKRKVRTALTIFSVVIGATSIIVMVSLGVALDEKFNQEIENMSNLTQIELSGYNDKITQEDMDKIIKMKNVTAITPIIQSSIKLLVGGMYVGTFDAVGIDPTTMDDFGYNVSKGRNLNETDATKYSLVFGSKAIYGFSKKGSAEPWYRFVEDLEEQKKAPVIDILNSKFKLYTDNLFGVKKSFKSSEGVKTKAHKSFNANGVGILELKEDWNVDHKVFMPFEMLQKYTKEVDKINGNKQQAGKKKQGYERVLVKVNDFNNVESVVKEIKNNFTDNKKTIGIYTEAEYIKSSKRMTSMVQALLGAIGSISLFIAAIGITNTMVMSIYERTKEIGIMKVIGASVSDIKNLFLIEATLIGFIGGAIGVLFSHLISNMINKFGALLLKDIVGGGVQKLSSIPVWLALGALIFSSLIGLLAGYLPARRVVKIEALKAIKS